MFFLLGKPAGMLFMIVVAQRLYETTIIELVDYPDAN